MAVAARVVRDLLVAAPRALQDMPAQGRRAAGRQVVEGATLLGRPARTVLFQKYVATAPDPLRHFEPRSGHGWASPPGGTWGPSNGMRVGLRSGGGIWRERGA